MVFILHPYNLRTLISLLWLALSTSISSAVVRIPFSDDADSLSHHYYLILIGSRTILSRLQLHQSSCNIGRTRKIY
ncbi:uncharacterized protein BJ212DRAFT_1336954 [Suillus subaureus]|uniref:Secreted protein n=1 Tax=Suillus subaureus TaxID=48587 RepID=A0A9P7JGJ2_9AGAM|nr:uncharacterized protein BJ212DRAFT_1336954 [Suillus subaureus]KAG1821023.1 hypothetical protein BJ212DRAFT_1336954 [Suillus subaureus]